MAFNKLTACRTKLRTSGKVGKIVAVLSLAVYLVQIMGIASPSWLEKEYVLVLSPHPNAAVLDNDNLTSIQRVYVDSHVGLLWECSEKVFSHPGHNVTKREHSCKSFTEIDHNLLDAWQKVSAGLGIETLVSSFISLVLTVVAVFRGDCDRRIGIVIHWIISGTLLTVCLVLYDQNRSNVKVFASPTIRVEYNVYWGFCVTLLATIFIFALALCNVVLGTFKSKPKKDTSSS